MPDKWSLPEDSKQIYLHLVRGDRTYPMPDPPGFYSDMMPENWSELVDMIDEFTGDLDYGGPDRRGDFQHAGIDTPDLATAARLDEEEE